MSARLGDKGTAIWVVMIVAALLLLDTMSLTVWSIVVCGAVLAVAGLAAPARLPARWSPDRLDLIVLLVLYGVVVAAFRVAFTGFTTDNIPGLFLSFAVGLVIGVAGPIVYQVWIRQRPLDSLGLTVGNLRVTLLLALLFAGIQFAVTLWGYDLPAAERWVPLLVMSLVVGLFEAVFFRGFVQNRLEASFGPGPAVAGAAALYALYHLGYGMDLGEMWFLLGLGVVYALAFRVAGSILVLWPLLTPLGAFFNNLDSGDIELPWASIAGFADVAGVMAVVVWLARRRLKRAAEAEATVGVGPA